MEDPELPSNEMRSLALTPTWSVATVLTVFVVVSLAVERSIHHLSNWLRKTNRKPLLAAVEKMKEELMLLGFISLLLTATSSLIANICVPTKFYDSTFAPCTRSEIDEEREDGSHEGRKLLGLSVSSHTLRRMLNGVDRNTCPEGHEPFVSFKGLEQLHRFIFVMAITHISYSCLTMLLAIVKVCFDTNRFTKLHFVLSYLVMSYIQGGCLPYPASEYLKLFPSKNLEERFVSEGCQNTIHSCTLVSELLVVTFNYFFDGLLPVVNSNLNVNRIHSWRDWEDEAHMDRHDDLTEITRMETLRRQTTFVRYHASIPLLRNKFVVWVTCFFRQFGISVVRTDYLTLRKGFILNHNLPLKYDFHSYMIRSMEEEFSRIVGVSGPLWGFVVAFMLFNVKGSNLYFWIAIIPITLVLLLGTKLQNIIATLSLESAAISGHFSGAKLKPRDDLFWFKKPELLLTLIHFILFQNAFELATFFWFWWQFGYNSCFIKNHMLVYIRLVLGFIGQFLCSYSTLPLYALVAQMGTNYKAALIPQRIRETIHGWGKAARRKRRHSMYPDDSTVHTDTSTVMSLEEDDHHMLDIPEVHDDAITEIELQQPALTVDSPAPFANEVSSRVGSPLLRPSASISPTTSNFYAEDFSRSTSMPPRRDRGV